MKKRFGVIFVKDAFVERYLCGTLSNRECIQKTLAAVNRAKVKVDAEQFYTLARLALNGEFVQLHQEFTTLEQNLCFVSGSNTALAKSEIAKAFKILEQSEPGSEPKSQAQSQSLSQSIPGHRAIRFNKALDGIDQLEECPNALLCSLVMNQSVVSGPEISERLQQCLQDILSRTAGKRDLAWRFPPPVLSKLEQTTEKSQDEGILGLAYDLALLGDTNCYYGAVLVNRDGKILSAGYNHRYDVRGEKSSKRKIIHAEVHALLQCQSEEAVADGVMYVVQVERRAAHFLNSTPCVMCTSALSKMGVRLCRYTQTEGPPGRLKISRNTTVDTGSLDIAKRSDTFAKVELDTLLRKHSLEHGGKIESSPSCNEGSV